MIQIICVETVLFKVLHSGTRLSLHVSIDASKPEILASERYQVSSMMIMKGSAMPFKVKRAALSSEVIRRLRNTSRDLSWAEKTEILTQFSNALPEV